MGQKEGEVKAPEEVCVCVWGGLLGNSFEFRLFDEARLFTFLSAPNIFSMFNTLTNISAKY